MIEAINIHKGYTNAGKELNVLRGLSLKIEKGGFTALVGPSGAGKSTLLHILGGLDEPTRGKVVFNGEDIYRLNDQALSRIRNKQIGFVFQFYNLLSEFTVLENVMMPALIGCVNKAQQAAAQSKALELLGRMGLAQRIGHFPSELSGGEKQRVAIARALINDPGLLLCDEPTGNLDSRTGEEILALIRKVSGENKMTVVMVTHNQELAATAQRVYHLKDGILAN
ncbi:MAG: ABC transporter ATP-binding protein [Candidatus Omnitrophica bacterium]|jgi:ABC-type lipoprotein export system ATPase subunit|nr:ABC transporter ATP-binding protein [Candidatus Omnitrophota bacterium]MDD5079657.1 ABC transporter ATP-binding protein [Candidatus Omnitrophota bacterium]